MFHAWLLLCRKHIDCVVYFLSITGGDRNGKITWYESRKEMFQPRIGNTVYVKHTCGLYANCKFQVYAPRRGDKVLFNL